MSTYIMYKNRNYWTTSERPEFSPSVYHYVGPKPPGKMNICHGVSFGIMKESIAQGLNHFMIGDSANGARIICGIVAAVLRIRVPYSEDENTLVQNLLSVMPGNYAKYIGHIMTEFSQPEGYSPDEEADCILEALFNETVNLRWGDSSWNESIRDGFDPTSVRWQDGNVILADSDSIAVNNLIWLIPEVEVNIFTFLYGRNKSKKGIASSENKYPLPAPEDMEESDDIEVFYHNYVFNKYLCITTGEEME